jgi:hypothetical protein
MNRRRWGIFALLFPILFFIACGSAADEAPAAEFASDAGEVAEGEPETAGRQATLGKAQEQLIIRTGNVDIVVADTEETMASIVELVNARDGWVVSSSVFQSGSEAKTGSLTVRVPVTAFEAILEQIQALALEVTRVSTSGEDVTEEYVDVQARLRNLEATAQRVRAFLDDADDVEDALAVNAELSRLESEIEALKGRSQYLEESAAFSTIQISLTPDALAQPVTVAGWRPQGIARDALRALVGALQALGTLAIWLIIVALPLGLIILLPLWLLFRVARRFRSRRRADTPEMPSEE